MSKLDKVKRHNFSKFNLQSVCVFSKCGHFEQLLNLKDTLHSCYIKRVGFEYWDKGIALGKPSVFNITCIGSSPTGVCYNVTSRNISIPSGQICLPIAFHNTLHHQKTIHFLHVGWIDVHFFVYNDVSYVHLIESFCIYDADKMNLPTLIFPIVFGTLGLLIILFGAAYIIRLYKKSFVEVADFDFHPTLTEKQSSKKDKFHNVICSIKNMFSRNTYDSDHTDPKKCEQNRSLRRHQSNCYDSL
ncbi:hypothetical protein Btru_068889 [Bulinus truncatus]|nr:hypothetical protein Btru_068889 [Bulinus truncatus]